MSYGSFKTIGEIARKFNIKVDSGIFLSQEQIQINQSKFAEIQEGLTSSFSYVSEIAIGENVISPILRVVAKQYNIPVWSHITFNVSKEEGLVGEPDFLIAPKSDFDFAPTYPVVCVAEAKKENFDEGWTQALAEMIASWRVNQEGDDSIKAKTIYGIVTTGKIWEFGRLESGNLFIREINSYSATDDLQKVLNLINWVFKKATDGLNLYNKIATN